MLALTARPALAGGARTTKALWPPHRTAHRGQIFVPTCVFRGIPHRSDARADACPPAGDTGDVVRYGAHCKSRPCRDTARTTSAWDAAGSRSARQSSVADVSSRFRGAGDFSGTAGIHLALILSI